MEELIYRRDCDLFAESLDYESMIHDTMAEHGLVYNYDFDEDKMYEFAYAILQKAQNVINTFRKFIEENKDELDALSIIYNIRYTFFKDNKQGDRRGFR